MIDRRCPEIVDDFDEFSFEASAARWKPHPAKPTRDANDRIPPNALIRELNRLAEMVGQEDGRVFRDAIDSLHYLKLVNFTAGKWAEHWNGASIGNGHAEAYGWGAHRVSELISCKFHGLSEREIVAFVVAEEELPAANFQSAWTRLRYAYDQRYPNREKPKRGRRPAAKRG